MPHFVYILRSSDGSYYVGHTTDLVERVARHNAGRGPAYTAVRRPVQMVFSEGLPSS
jgi:predicted GIY-YIG superfamily endonuclease